MLIWFLSDLHMELTRGWDLALAGARPNYDVLVVAGDLIPRMERGVAWLLARVTDRPIIYVGGNHEFYGTDLERSLEKARAAAAGTNVFVLENDRVEIDGVTFLGAVGWTDFDLFGNQAHAMQVAGEVMNDYKKIRTGGAWDGSKMWKPSIARPTRSSEPTLRDTAVSFDLSTWTLPPLCA